MLTLNTKKIKYYLYFCFVVIICLITPNIIPPYVKSIFYMISIIVILFLAVLDLNNLSIKSLKFMFFFYFLFLLSWLSNLDEGVSLGRIFLLAIIYPAAFLSIKQIIFNNSVYRVFFPLALSSIVILILSLFSTLNIYDFTYYHSDLDTLDKYNGIMARDSLSALRGVYLNQNKFGVFLIVSSYSLLITFLSKENGYKFLKSLLALMSILSIGFVLLTLSRATILAMATGFALYLIFSPVKIRIKFYIFCLIVFISIIFIKSSYFEILSVKIDSAGLSLRDIIWSDALGKLNEHKAFGIGLGNYIYKDGYANLSTHNVYLLFLVSLGVVGALPLLFILIKVLINIFKLYYKRNKSILYVIFPSVLISILIHQFFEVGLDMPLNPLSILFILTYIYIINHSELIYKEDN